MKLPIHSALLPAGLALGLLAAPASADPPRKLDRAAMDAISAGGDTSGSGNAYSGAIGRGDTNSDAQARGYAISTPVGDLGAGAGQSNASGDRSYSATDASAQSGRTTGDSGSYARGENTQSRSGALSLSTIAVDGSLAASSARGAGEGAKSGSNSGSSGKGITLGVGGASNGGEASRSWSTSVTLNLLPGH